MVKTSILASAILLLASAVSAFPTSMDDGLAPLYHSPEAETIANGYIVVLKDHLDNSQVRAHCDHVGRYSKRDLMDDRLDPLTAPGIKLTYDLPGLKGYSGQFDDAMLDHIRRSPEVAYVERDTMMYASELQRGAPWGLSRISHRDALTLRTFSKYTYNEDGGKGIKVYVIDTGINTEHVDFEGRAEWGATLAEGDPDVDGNGHGSHCSGTIAGKKYGVAKKAHPVAVKVLSSNGSGKNSWVIGGVDWAIQRHELDASNAKKEGKRYKGAVANMSLGGGKSRALDEAVNSAVDSGIVFAVAAGNDNRDACNYSPAASELAITVGASDISDNRAYFSNYGTCVDVFAPGLNILSVWTGSKTATNTISGTSMASPHVAGLAAYFLSLEKNDVTPKYIKDKILSTSSSGKIADVGKGSPNLLIFNNNPEYA
ncbi:serine protease 1 [Phycomyces nitens]|nr:serine protease 1 [Phycomyces nitens]